MKSSTARNETIFIVDDDPAICESLCDLLKSAGLEAQHYSSAEDFLSQWKTGLGGCLLLDVRLPGMSGMELQEKLLKSGTTIPIIFMTAYGDVQMVRKAFKLGAAEFLVKPFQEDELLSAIELALHGQRKQQKKDSLINLALTRIQSLTAREREVLDLVTAGFTNREIAGKLFLSIVTVKMHRGQMMKKMQAESVADLVKMTEMVKAADKGNRS
jgi:FixJ family two-component response regulator